MAEKDIVTKEYMSYNQFFADAFNFFLYDGEQVIHPEQLHELDTTAVSLPFATDGKSVALQKFRDGLKAVVAMTDGQTAYLILGNENESDINSAMTVRNMLYDAIQYSSQVEEYSKKTRLNMISHLSMVSSYRDSIRQTDLFL